jgi:hypothetical protein
MRWRRRAIATIVVLSLTLATHPWQVLAQQALDCGVNGFCVSGNVNNLLGLPQGTLKIVGYQPWDYVIHPPKPGAVLEQPWREAAASWRPLEAEARATLSALHGVPNDFRLPHAAASELRTQMLLRLIAIAQRKSQGGTLTDLEQDALDAFEALIVARRVLIAQKAVDEYARWTSDPCHYTVPVMPNGQSFGFDQYDPGPACAVGLPSTSGPPRPPTADQFKAYGAALAIGSFISADREAAWKDFDQAMAFNVGVLSAAVVGGVATILAITVPAVSTTFALIAGSSATFAFFTPTIVGGAYAAATSAGLVGTAVAGALPAFVIIAVVVAALYIVQFAEDQSILPELQQTLAEARVAPSIWALSQDSSTFGELLTTFLIPTSPDWTDAERVQADAARLGPGQRAAGDPGFSIDGVFHDTLHTWNSDGLLQETFMSQGWFVTRTRSSSGNWGPWRWALTLDYRSGTLSATSTRIAGIQPAGFIDTLRSTTAAPPPAAKTTQLFILDELLRSKTVTWTGNRTPVLAPQVSQAPTVGIPVTFTANASDPDSGQAIAGIRWYIEDPTYDPPRKSFDECSFTPPGKVDPLTGFVYQCPWRLVEDNAGAGVQHIYARPGTWGVRVMAMDSEGGVGSHQWTIEINNLAPDLVITQIPFFALPPSVPSITEGQTASIVGTVNYPGLGDGSWGALTTLIVEWGDGTVTRRAYPCGASDLNDPDGRQIESDRTCVLNFGSGGAASTYVPTPFEGPLPNGPWPFQFTHTYVHNPERPIPTPAQVKVYAMTSLGARTDTRRYGVTVNNVPTTVEPAPVCPFLPLGSILMCLRPYGDHRTIPVGTEIDLRARLFDLSGTSHFVTVTWGDGTSSANTVACGGPLCPESVPNVATWSAPPGGTAPRYFGFTHVYDTLGTHHVTLGLDDGAPNGKVTSATTVSVFGVATPTGPVEVRAGDPVAYEFDSFTPAGYTANVMPICTGGTASDLTASGFTCVFADVATPTATTVEVGAVIAGYTFSRALNVRVLPRPPIIPGPTDPPDPPNARPAIGAVANQTIRQNTTLAPVSFTVDDADGTPAALTVTAISSNQAVVPDGNLILGGSGATRTIALTPAAGVHGATTVTLTVSDGVDTASTTFIVSVVDATVHLAEGATGPFFDTDILIANPNAVDAPVEITFLREDGGPVTLARTLPATSRTTIRVDDIPELESTTFSTMATSINLLPIVVERTMQWDATGYGAHTETATAGAASEWYFAEGAAGYFSTFFLLANPHATPNTARVTFYREGAPEIVREYVLTPGSRTTIEASADPELRDWTFGTRVVFALPGAAERAMYFGREPLWQGGTASAGVTAPAREWFLAEGATGSYFTTYVLLANPNAAPAAVTLTYLSAGGPPVVREVTLAAGERLTRNVALEDPTLASAAVATRVTASLPIVVERSQYWGEAGWIEGHSSAGVRAAGTRWGFAEGRVGGTASAQTYVLIANPGAQSAMITATFLRTDGTTIVKTFDVAPESRFNIAVTGPGSSVSELADESFGIVIDSTQPVAVERSLYMNAGGVTWASGTNASGTPLPSGIVP